jgi:exonuclease VII large subunit
VNPEETFALGVGGGEMNWRVVQSGHALSFTLKDAQTQLRTVMFRSAPRSYLFDPEAGMRWPVGA